MRTVFFRVLTVDNKESALLASIRDLKTATGAQSFEMDPAAFASVPGSPFAYQASDRLRSLFRELPPFEGKSRIARNTNSVDDNPRYVRLFWEVEPQLLNKRWMPWSRGGAFSRFYFDLDTLVCWDESRSTYPGFLGTPFRPLERPASVQHFFRPGLTWPLRTNGLSVRVLPRGCIFTNKGPAAFVSNDDPEHLLALAAVANSRAFGVLVSMQLARTELAQSYVMGLIQQTPVPDMSDVQRTQLAGYARRAWSLKRSLDTANETSHAFVLPPGLNEDITGLNPREAQRELDHIQQRIDEITFALYGIGPEEAAAPEPPARRAEDGGVDVAQADDDDVVEAADDGTPDDANSAVTSWIIGVAFGRFDPRLATGERPIPPEPQPFDPLPRRSPGMWPEGEAPDQRVDVLVDDEGHRDDIVRHARAAADRARVETFEISREWIAKDFFRLHTRTYSKSRRKAPIYWQLATPSARYSVWLHIHAFSGDTLFRVQNDYVAQKLLHEERRRESVARDVAAKATAADRKRMDAQHAFVEELRDFLDEVKRVAPLWKPNLDDGVVINFAPLWRLVPHCKPWQKELKSTWDALCQGEYDWAHLAMRLWPERVIPKCAKDRSLAIAHSLEEVFWVEGADAKWSARRTPTRSIEELVRERTSPAVKAALKSLLDAPAAARNGGRARAGRRRSGVADRGDA